ncbi:MAG: hypothetical protein E7323_04910 [Clostridiales bacterium]|nr:hypothetical protein [Clostridiales bacterium]
MGFFITDSKAGVYLAGQLGEPLRCVSCDYSSPCWPCASKAHLVVACRSKRECLCIHQDVPDEPLYMPALPGLGGVCLSPCGRYLYQLSTEADCIHTFHLGSGELQYAMPAGVFPRSMQLNHDGSQLLVAGGCMDEAYLLSAPELYPLRTLHTRHPCFAADFCKGGYALLCAMEGDELQSVLYMLSQQGVRPREKLRLPGQPGSLRVCPDGETALLSTPDGLMRVVLSTGELLWNQPEWALCMRMEIRGHLALISDTLCGCVVLIDIDEPWKKRVLLQGTDAQACFLPMLGKAACTNKPPVFRASSR